MRILKNDWSLGLLVSVTVFIASNTALLQNFERIAYDLGVRNSERFPSEKVAVIAIDDVSIANIGRWPWPRDLHANMIDMLSAGGAKAIGQTVFFLEPQLDPGHLFIREIGDYFDRSSLPQAANSITEPVVKQRVIRDVAKIGQLLQEASGQLSTDTKLAESILAADNVVMAMPFMLGIPRGKPDSLLPDFVLKNSIVNIHDRIGAQVERVFPITAIDAIPPIEEFGQLASAIGHLNVIPDVDGGIRSEALVVKHFDRFYPSIALQLAAKSLNLTNTDIKINLGESVELGSLQIKTDAQLMMKTFYYSDIEGWPAFQVDSFYDVFSGKIPIEKYNGKIVLIGATATGVGANQVTPVDPAMPPVLTLAHSVSSILNEDFFTAPSWSGHVELGTMLLIAIYIMFVLARMRAGTATIFSATLLIALLGANYVLMTEYLIWLQLMSPAALLVFGHLAISIKVLLVNMLDKINPDIDGEINLVLGQSFQERGNLDRAFNKFSLIPLNDSLMKTLYDLALDMENKQFFDKALDVYSHMAAFNPAFKDITQRIHQAKSQI